MHNNLAGTGFAGLWAYSTSTYQYTIAVYYVRNSETLTYKHCLSPKLRRVWRHLTNQLPKKQRLRDARRIQNSISVSRLIKDRLFNL